jgi:allophanate hydrolase
VSEVARGAVDRVRAAFAAVAAVDRPEVWVHLRAEAEVLAEAADVDARTAAGEDLPLAGLLLAVKNNVDLAGVPTTAGCPPFAVDPAAQDAVCVARLRAAGAVALGATNLDQFATGLVGTRSPHGAVRDARRPDRISGGSSSGSAVAVALGLVDLAIGTDTAGSGRVPAALQGVVGIKPTPGVVPVDGVVPACRSWDCVTVFARDLPTAERAMGVMAGGARPWPADVPLAAPSAPRVAVPRELPGLAPAWAAAFARVVDRMDADGMEVVPVDLGPFLQAARLLYDGGLVAERHAAVGDFVDAHPGEVDPVVAAIIGAAGAVPASRYVTDTARLEQLRAVALAGLAGTDVLVVPTAPEHPTLAEVAADPVGVNSRLGTYTNFCNLFDLSAVAVPAGTVDDGSQLGVTVVGRPFADAVAADVARRLVVPVEPPALRAPVVGAPVGALSAAVGPWPVAAGARAVSLVVVGAHRRGQPLVHELERRGAAWAGRVRTAAAYRLLSLGTVPPKPGLVRAEDGASIVGERWWLSEAALGSFLADLPAPMQLGRVELADGSWSVGFACDAVAAATARDVTEFGDWLAVPGVDLGWGAPTTPRAS